RSPEHQRAGTRAGHEPARRACRRAGLPDAGRKCRRRTEGAPRGLTVAGPLVAARPDRPRGLRRRRPRLLGASPAAHGPRPVADSRLGILGVIGHSNTHVRLPSAAPRLVMTPHFHALHHSIDRALPHSNYTNILPIRDLLLGTFTPPDRHL